MTERRIHVLDCETTGLEPLADRIVELAMVEVLDEFLIGESLSTFVKPHKLIPPEATAVHHIIDSDLIGAPDLGPAITMLLGSELGEGADILAAHNARFDRDFLPQLKGKRWIDTWRCAMHVWPEAPNYQNGTLYYWLGFPRIEGAMTHRALFDATMTARILIRLLGMRTVAELLKLSTKAVLQTKVGFGKHHGQLWTEVPSSYLAWAKGQDMDPDVKFTVKSEIARRDAAARPNF